MSQMYPEVRDISSLSGTFNLPQYLTIGIEGQADNGGSASVAVPQVVTTGQEADTYFGANSSLAKLIKFVLGRGVNFVYAVASKKGSAPLLTERQTAWETLEENPEVRIRLTDSVTQADLVALADSCEYAEGIQNKQFCIVGLATPTTDTNLTTAATAIASKRGVLIGPGFFDDSGTLQDGSYSAALAAAEVARNPDITDDLDTLALAGTTGIETDTANGMPLFRLHAGGGTPVNDFETLLDAGVSVLRTGRRGTAEIVHLRPTYKTDDTYDALMTLLIKDQLFIDIRTLLEGELFLRRGNTPDNRSYAASIVDAALKARNAWLLPKDLPGGGVGYGVSVTASSDKRKMIVSGMGEIVRNTQTIDISLNLSIPV